MAIHTVTIQGKIGDPVIIVSMGGEILYSSYESSGKTFPASALYEGKWNFKVNEPEQRFAEILSPIPKQF